MVYFSINNSSTYLQTNNYKKKSAVKNTPNFTGKNTLKLTKEVQQAINSKDMEAARNYFERFANMAITIFRRNSAADVIKTLQTLVDKVASNSTKDKVLLNKYVEILYKGTCPNVGTGKYLNAKKLQKAQNLPELTIYSKEMLKDIIKETSKK